MLTSKELLDKTGISRATLNNYIASGVVARPEVLPPGPQHGAAPRIGYFPDGTLERIHEIQRRKRDGWSMARIAEHFGASAAATPRRDPAAATDDAVERPASAIPQAPPASAAAQPPPPPNAADPGRSLPVVLTPVAVLCANLENAHRVWIELPPEEYFELINQIWVALDPIFRRHHGTPGKHSGDGITCCFMPQQAPGSHLWNAVVAALEIRDAMPPISRQWQQRKGWAKELHLNTGIDDGQEWRGALRCGGTPEFTALAGTIRQAARISEFSRAGGIWVTKNLLGRLRPEERAQLKYGVRRKNAAGEEIFVPAVFSSADALASAAPDSWGDFSDLALVPIAEILDITTGRKLP